MEIQTKHRVTLLNAKCDLVNKLYNICKASEYGDVDMKCAMKEMYAKVKLINRLDCYVFSNPFITTTTNGTVTIGAASTLTFLAGTYILKNGDTVLSTDIITVNTSPIGVISNLLSSSGLSHSFVTTETGRVYTVIVDCLNSNIKLYYNGVLMVTNFTILLAPVCATNYTTTYNCLEDSDLPKMYEVLNSLAK